MRGPIRSGSKMTVSFPDIHRSIVPCELELTLAGATQVYVVRFVCCLVLVYGKKSGLKH